MGVACRKAVGKQRGVNGQPEARETPSCGGYHSEGLDSVDTRLARIEGQMPHMASKDDVANAKLTLIMAWVGVGVSLLVGAILIAVRILTG